MKTRLMSAIVVSAISGLIAGVLIGGLLQPGGTRRDVPDKVGKPGVDESVSGKRSLAGQPSPSAGAKSASAGLNTAQPNVTRWDFSRDDDEVIVSSYLIEGLSLASGVRTMDQPLFDREGGESALLQITDHEKASLQTAWRGIKEDIREIEATASYAEELTNGGVRITIMDLSEMRQGIGSQFSSKAREILGDNRARIFMAVKQIERLLDPPAGERSYTVDVEPAGDHSWRYRMTLEGPSGRRIWVGASIPEEIRHVTDAAGILPRIDDPWTDDEME